MKKRADIICSLQYILSVECGYGLLGSFAFLVLNIGEHGTLAAVGLAEAEVYLGGEGEPLPRSG